MKSLFKSALACLVRSTIWWSIVTPEARAAEPQALSLSLDEALSRAKAESPEVTSARFAVREADAHRVGAGLVMPQNPRLAVDARPLISGGSGTMTSPVTEPPAVGEVRSLVERALTTHPQLKALKARLALLNATEERLRAEVFPRVGFYAGLDAAPLSPTFGVLGGLLSMLVREPSRRVSYSPMPRLAGGVEPPPEERAAG